jgi:2-isopropylmalate synthase
MEEVVMALKTRKDLFGLRTGIRTEYPPDLASPDADHGHPVQPNKAIVGDNAFAHESGIHQDGVLKETITYEIMTPQSVGISETHIVLGSTGAARHRQPLREMGYGLVAENSTGFRPFQGAGLT